MAGVRRSPAAATEKWRRNITGATETIREGVALVTEAPGKKAAAAQEKMKRNLNEAIDSGKWARRVEAVGLAEWQDKMTSLGIPRIAAGAAANTDKVEMALEQIYEFIDGGQAKIRNMPSVTVEDNIQRMVTFVRHMSEQEVKR